MNNIIGQPRILNEVTRIISKIKSGENFAVLLRAPSGHGKTTLLKAIMKELGEENCFFYSPNSSIKIITSRRFHFLDEIHTMKGIEILYPFIDSGKYSFFMATNFSGSLPEALKNRTIQLIFDEYDNKIIGKIVKNGLNDYPDDLISFIAEHCKGNPRIATILTKRIQYMTSEVPKTKEELQSILNTLGIYEGGLNDFDLKYINFLKSLPAKRSSLQNIIAGTNIDRVTILEEIEPFLIKKGIIQISSRGRELIKENV